MKKVITDSSEFLKKKALSFGYNVFFVANYLLDDERFKICSGSSKENEHHYGNNGLIQHTAEVVRLTEVLAKEYKDIYQIDETVLFLAALFHDSGKMYDYVNDGNVWKSAPHKRYIHHISRSGIIWNDASQTVPDIYSQYFESVLHCILSHHMERQFGSPVSPKSREAWLLTLCDNVSARMFDADTNDLIKRGKT